MFSIDRYDYINSINTSNGYSVNILFIVRYVLWLWYESCKVSWWEINLQDKPNCIHNAPKQLWLFNACSWMKTASPEGELKNVITVWNMMNTIVDNQGWQLYIISHPIIPIKEMIVFPKYIFMFISFWYLLQCTVNFS